MVDNGIIKEFLNKRGLSIDDMDYLLNPNSAHEHDPFLIYGMDEWVECLHRYKGEEVTVMPDYDADGVFSGTVARVGLYILGFGVVYVYPPKVFDGYGLSQKSVDNILKERPNTKLIITTDNGSNAHEGIKYAKSKSIEVLVTDHHKAKSKTLALASVNPNETWSNCDTYPYSHISGTTVIYKALLAYALKYELDESVIEQYKTLILLVGMATVSDVMPMLNENRYYVVEAIKMFERFIENSQNEYVTHFDNTPLGQYFRGVGILVNTLKQNNKLNYGIDADTFGFMTGPMLNSPRRMLGDSTKAFELFQTNNNDVYAKVYDEEGLTVSDELFEINEHRKSYVRAYTGALLERVSMSESVGISPVHYAVFNTDINAGVSGLLAGNFTNTYGLPSVAFSVRSDRKGYGDVSPDNSINLPITDDYIISGSARAPEGFDLYKFLTVIDESHPGLIVGWGGHPQAAGLSIHSSNFETFRSIFVGGLADIISKQDDVSDVDDNILPIDSEYVIKTDVYDELLENYNKPIDLFEIDVTDDSFMESVEFFESIEPYGVGFNKPSFSIIFNMSDVGVFYMGADKQHVKITLPNGFVVICWNGSETFSCDDATSKTYVVTGGINLNEFRGMVTPQLIANSVQELC